MPGVQPVHVKAHLLALAARGIAPATRSSALFALRSFYEYLRSENLIAANPMATIRVPGARKLRTEIYTDAEADLMLAWGAIGRNDVDLGARRISLVGKGTRPASCPSLPRSCPSSTTT